MSSIGHEEIERVGKRDVPSIVHFEIPSDNIERSKKFYKELFGWKIENWPGRDGILMISTTDDKGNEALGGVMMKRQDPQQGITIEIGVDSIDEYSSQIIVTFFCRKKDEKDGRFIILFSFFVNRI